MKKTQIDKHIPFSSAVDGFRLHIEARGLSTHTIADYARAVAVDVPQTRPFAVLIGRALDLVSGGGCIPQEPVGKGSHPEIINRLIILSKI